MRKLQYTPAVVSIRIRFDTVIFGLPDPVLFFSQDPDPTCKNGYVILFQILTTGIRTKPFIQIQIQYKKVIFQKLL